MSRQMRIVIITSLILSLRAINLYDPEKLLPRAAESLNESMQYLVSYQNSVRFGREHYELVRIMDNLEKLERKLTVLI